MAWIGKIIGGTVGFLIGGPIGAGVGAGIGAAIDESIDEENNQLTHEQALQLQFFVSTFTMAGKIAIADGKVSQEEVYAIEGFIDHALQLDQESKTAALNIFKEASTSDRTFNDFANDFYSLFQSERTHLLAMIELLLSIAAADGEFHIEEDKLILSAVNTFRLSDDEYKMIKSVFFEDNSKYYSILNCSPNDSFDTIKRNYRKLIQDYHPDKISSKGLPDEFIKFANAKFQEIKEAYDKIKKEKNIR